MTDGLWGTAGAEPGGNYRVIVIGSGISGLFVALEVRHLGPVLVLTKGSIEDCNTRWAQGGIAAAVGALDSPEEHLADTIVAGAGLVDEEAARILCYDAPARIRDLVEHGVSFDSIGGEVALGREAAHSAARVLHAGGDRTGAAIETALSEAARMPGITILDHTLATELTVEGDRVNGVVALDLPTGKRIAFEAPAVVLATGGAGQMYKSTTNPDVTTGDGIVLGFQAGAEVADLEFYQFHPTAFRRAGSPPFLITEAMRGDGAILRNATGEAFMARYHALADLAPRDVVARATVAEMRREGSEEVWLDCTGIEGIDLAARFPGVYAFCRGVGIDITKDRIPVAPAAHYMMGGVRTDTMGRTTVAGLYACGEVACTGVHGANRLASNSLMETVVFGKRVVEDIAAGGGAAMPATATAIGVNDAGGIAPDAATVRTVMWDSAGIERDREGLAAGLAAADEWHAADVEPSRAGFEVKQMSTLARLMLRAALERTESRGAHSRRDFPERDDMNWQRHLVYRRAD
ncbi:MAG: L-aspartate oxidase [Tepidiformaceae bacterium]